MKNLCIAIFLAAGLTQAQEEKGGTIRGVVLDRDDRRPLGGVNVQVQATVTGTTTDTRGRFVLGLLPPGTYSLSVSIVGYERRIVTGVTIPQDQDVDVEIELVPTAVSMEPVVVTASKYEQSLQDVPVSVSVLDYKELTYRNTVTIDDALRYVPGVNMTQGQVNIRGSTGYSRGVGTRVLLLVDGLPLISGDTGEIIWESLPVYHIDKIEVVKGAGSALYGSSALGGVINVITKKVEDEPETRARAYGGMYETPAFAQWRWTDESRFFNGISLLHAQRFGNTRMYIGGSRSADESFKRNDSWRRWNGSVNVGHDFSPFESIGLLFSILDQRRGNFLFWKDLENALEPKDEQLVQQVQSTRWNLGAHFRKFVSNEFHYNAKATWFRNRWEDNFVSLFDSSGDRSRSDFLNGEIQASYRASDVHMLTFGVYGTFSVVSADTIFGNHTGYGSAVYMQDEIDLGLKLTVGGRYDWQRLEGTDAVGQFNPKLGLAFSPWDGTHLRMAVGRGFRAPSVAEVFTTTEAGGVVVLPNPDLRPERAWSFEVGASRAFEDVLFVNLALFQNEFWDLIEPTFGIDGNVRFRNVTRARIQGLELVLQTNSFRRALETQVGYTYMFPRDVSTQDVLKYRPRHLLHVSARLSYEALQLGLDYRYSSRVERIDDEFVTLGIIPQGDKRVAISVADVRLSVDWRFLSIPLVSSFHVNNVFGYRYVELIGNIAPLRNFVLTLEAGF